MQIKDLLPIGTIVVLNDGTKPLMIFGIKQTDENGAGQEYDYIGVIYPEGNIGAQYQFLFNHADIKEILFRGYEDNARDSFLEKLEEVYSNG